MSDRRGVRLLGAYAEVLSVPGALRFSATGLVARLPIAMVTLGIVLLVSGTTGSYAYAGQVSAAYVLASAVAAIPQGRLMDRFGQRTVITAASLGFGLGLGLLVQAVLAQAPTPLPHLAAMLAGLSQPLIGSAVRARWQHVLERPRDLQTAFALEAVVDEMVFMAGPTVVTFLATLWHPAAGLVAALTVGTAGGLALAAQRATQPTPHPRTSDPASRVSMPWGALAPLALGATALGTLFGSTEVATVAFAEDRGATALSGVLLAVWAFGSLLAGLITGAVHWRISTVARLRRGGVALTVTMAATPFASNLIVLGAVLFVAGFAISPTLIAAVSRLEEVTPRARFAESMGLLHTGIGAGTAIGAALSGIVVDAAGGAAAYWVGVGGGAVTVLCGLLAREDAARENVPGPDPRGLIDAVGTLGGHDVASADALAADLMRRWAEPHRTYHDGRHLAETLTALDLIDEPLTEAERAQVVLALWFHDAVYDATDPSGNEEASARLAESTLPGLGVAPGDVAAVAALVRDTTAHEVTVTSGPRAVLHDVDLWILAAPAERFDEYCEQVRAEYAHVPDDDFGSGRAAVLAPFAAREAIYRTSTARARWETAARENLGRELARLAR